MSARTLTTSCEARSAIDDPSRPRASLRIRRVRPHDVRPLDTLIRSQSPRTRRLRFHAALKGLPAPALQAWVRPDGLRHHGLVVEGQDGALLADARLHVCPDRRCAEFGLLVDERWQRRGIGRRLLETLADIARRHGARELVADVLPDNVPMLALAARTGFRVLAAADAPGVLEIRRVIG